MNVLLGAIIGFFAGRMLWLAVKDSWATPALIRRNYRGVDIPTAAGAVFCFALVAVETLRAIFGALGFGSGAGLSPLRAGALIVALGFCFLGAFDDLAGNGDVRGLRGHIKSLTQGRITTGGIKMFGGIAISLVAASLLGPKNLANLVLDAAVIALAANLANLFDRRPGRAIKVSLIGFLLPAVALGLPSAFIAPAIIVGAAAALLLDDLHERLMIGDTGANVLGGAIGLAIVGATGMSGTGVALVMLVLLTLVGEFVSFSKLFDSIGPLRAFDRLGTKRLVRGSARPGQNSAEPTATPLDEQAAPSFGDDSARQEEWPSLLTNENQDDAHETPYEVDASDPTSRAASEMRAESMYAARVEDEIDLDDEIETSNEKSIDEEVLDLRADEIDLESETEQNRASLSSSHGVSGFGARVHREPRPSFSRKFSGADSPSPRNAQRSAFNEHSEEFDDLPDFSSRKRNNTRDARDGYRSPFDDHDN